jgi:hypothetical protein
MKFSKSYLIYLVILLLALVPLFVFDYNSSLTGAFSIVDVAPGKFDFEIEGDVSKSLGKSALVEIEVLIEDLQQRNFSTKFVKVAQLEAMTAYDDGDYAQVLKLVKLVEFVKAEQIELSDKLELLSIKIRDSKRQNYDTERGEKLFNQAVTALRNDQFDEASGLIRLSNNALDSAKSQAERSRLLKVLSRSFLLRNWWIILIGLILITAIAIPTTKIVLKRERLRKISRMKFEISRHKDQIKKLQKICFIDKKISSPEYKVKVAEYEKRIAEIKHTLPVLQGLVSGKTGDKKTVKNKIIGMLRIK